LKEKLKESRLKRHKNPVASVKPVFEGGEGGWGTKLKFPTRNQFVKLIKTKGAFRNITITESFAMTRNNYDQC